MRESIHCWVDEAAACRGSPPNSILSLRPSPSGWLSKQRSVGGRVPVNRPEGQVFTRSADRLSPVLIDEKD
jgi:hypothetical protein